jgi:hypothetical protein
MVNQESRFATDAFGDTIVQCLGCNGWTSDLEGEVCECCREQGLSRELINMYDEMDYYDDAD